MKKTLTIISLLLSFNAYSLTIDEIEELANNGYDEYQFKMGMAYEFGKGGMPIDLYSAETWYLKSKTDKAYSRLAVISFNDGDYDLAKKYLKQPLSNKFPYAFLYTGKIMLIEDNKEEGLKYIKFAALKGVPEAMYLHSNTLAENRDFYNAYIYASMAKMKNYKKARSTSLKYKKSLNSRQLSSANAKIKKQMKD